MSGLFGALTDPRVQEALALWRSLSPERQKLLIAYARKLEREQKAEQARSGGGWGPPR